jgi:threonine/homoserine efflux transporter RhtA
MRVLGINKINQRKIIPLTANKPQLIALPNDRLFVMYLPVWVISLSALNFSFLDAILPVALGVLVMIEWGTGLPLPHSSFRQNADRYSAKFNI